MSKPATHKTLDAFLYSLERQQVTVAAWARSKGFATRAVYSVISGHHNGTRGKAREILKAMGLQPPPMFPRRANGMGAATRVGAA